MRLFLFGTLLWPDLLTRVAGHAVVVEPARLSGFRVARASAGDWPMLTEDAGAVADGILTEPLSADALARIDWYEGGFSCHREAVLVDGPDGSAAADVYKTGDAPGEAWSLADWKARNGARTLIAAEEIMRAFGRESADALAARRAIIHARAGSRIDTAAYSRPATVGGTLDRTAITGLERVPEWDGFNAVETIRFAHRRFDGDRAGPVARAVTHVAQAATVLPYDPVRDRVLVVEQVRAGAVALDDPRPWMLEPVAGLVDTGDSPEATAMREAREEAGLELSADALRFVARYYPSPGGLAQVLFSYVALCDLPDGSAGLGGLEDEAEDIRAHLVPLDDLVAMIDTGEAANAPLILSAQWLALNRSGLRRQ